MEKQNKIGLALRYLCNRDYRDYRRVRVLNVFDPDYFLNLLKRDGREDLVKDFEEAIDPFWFYFRLSRKQLSSADISANNWNQLLDPCPLFDTYFYLARNRDQIGSQHPLSHYLLEGWKLNLHPSPYFDPDYYRENYHWHEKAGNPLLHYINHHLEAAQDCSVFFSHGWYLDRTPLPEVLRRNAVKHYKLHGALAGKSSVPVFEPDYYARQISTHSPDCPDPLLHYLSVGEEMGIPPSPHFDPDYYRTRYQNEKKGESVLAHYLSAGVFQKSEINQDTASLQVKPIISIIVPVYNPKPEFLNNCVRSVLYQTYPYWELWLVDDCSTADEIRQILDHWAAQDKRINTVFNDRNRGISATTQRGADQAAGDYLGFLDNDDELAPDCLYQVAKEINLNGADLIYSDEDLIGDDGSCHELFYKQGFNRALLYSHNYITHFVVVSRDLFDRSGGLNSEYDGAQDYDLMLRLSSHAGTIGHIPKILYHWRAVETSTSIDHQQKPFAHEAGKKALQKILDSKGQKIRVVDTPLNYHYSIRVDLQTEPSVLVLVMGDRGEEQKRLVEHSTDYANCSFQSLPAGKTGGGASSSGQMGGTQLNREVEAIQGIIAQSSADHIAILGYGAPRINPEWLTELVAKSQLEEDIAIVCGRMSYAGHDGPSYTLPDVEDQTVSYFASFLSSASRHASGLHNLQYVNCCDFHICLIRRSDLIALGGFDFEHFPRYLTMLDLCYRALDRGKKILYTPDAMVTYESTGSDEAVEDPDALREKDRFQRQHRGQLGAFDQWYNSGHLSKCGLSREEFYRWLTGTTEETTLDANYKLK